VKVIPVIALEAANTWCQSYADIVGSGEGQELKPSRGRGSKKLKAIRGHKEDWVQVTQVTRCVLATISLIFYIAFC
jgi:DNA invertase Pin-like site-specific DNA recombinase